MEYVEGRSLRDLIRTEGPLEPGQAADIAAEIASALAFAHRSGVVHRDVKPGNVLLTQAGTVKVTDFGIARAGASDGLTQTGSVMGTANYFSPEQAQGLAVDGRSDVYSVGVVLYEMVCGVPPFTADSPVSVAYKHVREEPVPPSQRNPDVPPALEQIILSALAKDPDHRYQSADDLRADILRFRRGRPARRGADHRDRHRPAHGRRHQRGHRRLRGGDRRESRASRSSPPTPLSRAPPAPAPSRDLHDASRCSCSPRSSAASSFAAVKLGNNQKTVDRAQRLEPDRSQSDPDARRAPRLVPVTKLVASSEEDQHRHRPEPRAGDQREAEQHGDDQCQRRHRRSADPRRLESSTVERRDQAAREGPLPGRKVDPSQPSTTVDPDHIISTNPPIGTTEKFGTTIHLIPSSGVTVPNVVGLANKPLPNLLSQAGLTVRTLHENSDSFAAGKVTRTNPPVGTSNLKGGSVIEMYVSTGRRRSASRRCKGCRGPMPRPH